MWKVSGSCDDSIFVGGNQTQGDCEEKDCEGMLKIESIRHVTSRSLNCE